MRRYLHGSSCRWYLSLVLGGAVAVTATILLLDLGFDGDQPIAKVHTAVRPRSAEHPTPRIRCYFRAKTPPDGSADVGGLGIHVESQPDIDVQTPGETKLARSAGRLSYDFGGANIDQDSVLELLAVFPNGWFPAEILPSPHEATISNDRIVVRWLFEGLQSIPSVSWRQQELTQGGDLAQIEEGITGEGQARHLGKPITKMAPQHGAKLDHVVILVHGINTMALWQNEISSVLRGEGFEPRPVGYDKFGVWSFLRRSDKKRRKAIAFVSTNILDARTEFPDAKISIIAHSFGTYVVMQFLEQNKSFQISRLILCGSVLPRLYSFVSLATRLLPTTQPDKKIVNECGTHDVWPVLGGRATKRYGPSGTFGSNDGRVLNRWHNYMWHSGFLNAPFCRKFWVPFLKNGIVIPGEQNEARIPWWIRLLARLPLKSMLIAVPALFGLCWLTSVRPDNYRIYAGAHNIGHANITLTDIKTALLRSSQHSCPTDCLRGRERVTVESVDSAKLARIVVPGEFICKRCYPMEALRKFIATFPACLRVEGMDTGRLSIDVNPSGMEDWTDSEGQQWKRCKVRVD